MGLKNWRVELMEICEETLWTELAVLNLENYPVAR
tara:strand:+ start:95 stop:199 length:105 start_codon:yes stop_codon:yes gene_type:complete